MIHEGNRPRRGAQRGFTLAELMIVVVIVGILGAIAYPGFRDQARRAARSDAKTSLMDAMSRQEQFFLDNKAYTTNLAALNLLAATENDYYQISVDAPTGGCPIANCYSMSATPQGRQTDDSQCGTLTINSSGVKGATGTNPATCW